MKISRKQLRQIIKEIAVADADAVYDDANTAAVEIVENMMNNYGPGPEILAAVDQPFREEPEMAQNDPILMQ